ncbi:MAG: DinB family protein, partial [Actinomycetota bacterium]|nr:DinB family protein [Actinomycetota bacterium]
MASIVDRCPTCGIDPRTVSPSDAVVALRSYRRRYRALLVRPDDEEGAEVVRRRPAPDRWSAVEHAAHVADVFETTAEALHTIRVHDDPVVTVEPGAPRA